MSIEKPFSAMEEDRQGRKGQAMHKDWPQQNRSSISNLDSSVQKVLMIGHVDVPNIFNWTVCKRCSPLCKEGRPKRGSETVHLSSSSVS